MRLRALFFSLVPLAAASAQPADSLRADSLREVTVTAAREALATRDAPARVTVIDRTALDATASASVADALAARAPLHVRRYGPSGLATVTIRGASSSQALVLLDGQRLSDPQLGQVDLGLLPTALLESVEVLSGPASGLYGSDALGGVVHLRPPVPGEGAEARLTTEAGPWGDRRASGLAMVHLGAFHSLVAAETGRAEDDYSYLDRTLVGAPRVSRQGWDSNKTALYTSVGTDVDATSATASVWLTDAERGLGGNGVVGERQWDRILRFGATATRQTGWGRIEVAGTLQRSRLRYANPFPATVDRPDALDETGETTTLQADLRATTNRLRRWVWTGALAAGLGRADHPSLEASAEDRFAGVALSGIGHLGRATLFPSFRIDGYAPANGGRQWGVGPQVGANVALTDALNLKASVGRAFRMPTLNDRFWLPGGNPDLRPETAWSADAGAVWLRPGLQAEATAFGTTAHDQIVWAPTVHALWSPSNVARTRTVGIEASARGARSLTLGGHPARLDGGALATALDARDLDTDQPLRYVPRWTTKAWAGLSVGIVRLDLGARLVGPRFTTASGSQALPAHAVLDAQIGVRQSLGGAEVALAVAAENLTDARYQVVRSYPMPPRHARLRLTVRTR